LHLYASSCDEEADCAFVLAAKLEAALLSFADLMTRFCHDEGEGDSRSIIDAALRYGVNTCPMDEDVYDNMDALEKMKVALLLSG